MLAIIVRSAIWSMVRLGATIELRPVVLDPSSWVARHYCLVRSIVAWVAVNVAAVFMDLLMGKDAGSVDERRGRRGVRGLGIGIFIGFDVVWR